MTDNTSRVDLTEDELALVRAALEAYLEEFGHEEQHRIKLIQRVLEKLGCDPSRTMTR